MKVIVLSAVLALSVPMAFAGDAAVSQREATQCSAMACLNAIGHHGAQLLKYGLEHSGPCSLGFLSGLVTAGLETEIINPIVSYVLAGYSDALVVATEAGIVGAAGYMAYTHLDEDAREEMTKPATMLGLLASLVVWYQFHG